MSPRAIPTGSWSARKAASSAASALLAAALAVSGARALPADLPALPAETVVTPMAFADLDGWTADGTGEAWRVLHRHCRHLLGRNAPLRPGAPAPPAVLSACSAVLSEPETLDDTAARALLERLFRPLEIVPPSGRGFLTGYYEPEVAGSLAAAPGFAAPLLSRPDDLVSQTPGETPPGWPEGLVAARRTPDGLAPYPTRAEIETAPPGTFGTPLVWLADAVEVFMMQVQGSGRVRLPDGSVMRIAYAGRNGHPYSSVGRLIVQSGLATPEQMTLEPLKAFLRADAARGRELMHQNRSYVFFRHASELPADRGPIGGAGIPLTPWRSIAVDRAIWPYGLPVWIETALPLADGAAEPFRRLTVAEDTGSAIIGPARADLFHGAGGEAGRRAGALRHPMRFVVLWPRAVPLP